MATRVLDITGQPCDACAKGVAKVVHFVKESGNDRFFFGCSASTKDAKCSGPRAWQSIQVPANLKVTALQEKGVNREPKTRGRAKKNVVDKKDNDGSSDSAEFRRVDQSYNDDESHNDESHNYMSYEESEEGSCAGC